ncbi:FAD binding domain protein, partial [Vibrio parahaemolyticus 970107]
ETTIPRRFINWL